MTDLEMTKACAEEIHCRVEVSYNPIYDDAQAMELVKKLGLSINGNHEEPRWSVCWFDPDSDDEIRTHGDDLNRAIVECVAKLKERR